jgi:hypothetical protein
MKKRLSVYSRIEHIFGWGLSSYEAMFYKEKVLQTLGYIVVGG